MVMEDAGKPININFNALLKLLPVSFAPPHSYLSPSSLICGGGDFCTVDLSIYLLVLNKNDLPPLVYKFSSKFWISKRLVIQTLSYLKL